MRLSYFAHWTEGATSGVFHKIVAQVGEWSRRGHSVSFGLLSSRDTEAEWRSALPAGVAFHFAQYRGGAGRIAAPGRLLRALLANHPDLLYVRNTTWVPAMSWAAARTPLVLECNSNDWAERTLAGVRFKPIRRVTREMFLKQVAGGVFMSDVLMNHPDFANLRGPRIVLGNSIDFDSIAHLAPPDPAAHRLLMLSSAGQPWQGIDELPALLDLLPEWMVDVVGVQGDGTAQLPLHPRLHYHGRLSREQFQAIAANATAGIGTLALHRLAMDEIAPLKHREYLAMGLPVVLGCRDPDIPMDAPYALFVPNRSGSLAEHAGAVQAFLDGWQGRRVERTAVPHIDAAAKEATRLAFFQDVITGHSVVTG